MPTHGQAPAGTQVCTGGSALRAGRARGSSRRRRQRRAGGRAAPVRRQLPAQAGTRPHTHVHTHMPPQVPEPPHRLWPLLVAELTPVKALAHDGIFGAAHGLWGQSGAQGQGTAGRQDRFLGRRSVGAQTPIPLPSLPHLLQVPEEKVIVFIQKPWEGEADTK